MSKTHNLKTWPGFFAAVKSNRKQFEIRQDDRGFEVGDILRLQEWDPHKLEYTGEEVARVVVYITGWEQKPGQVVMGLLDPVKDELLAALKDLAVACTANSPSTVCCPSRSNRDRALSAIAKAEGRAE